MSESFSVGEIVVIQNATKPGFNGMEVTITGGLGCRYMRHVGPVFCYELSFHDADGLPYLARPHQIRKRRPPMDPAYVQWRNNFILEHALHV